MPIRPAPAGGNSSPFVTATDFDAHVADTTSVHGLTASEVVTTTIANATYAKAALQIADVAEPWTLYHRGLPNMVPENTMESFRAAVTAGAQVLELDFWLCRDGSLVCMHDSTLTRTTSSSGNTADLDAASIVGLVVDEGATMGGAWTSQTLKVPTFQQVLDEFGGRVILVCEGKNSGAVDAMVEIVDQRPWLSDSVIFSAFSTGWLTSAVTAGYATALYRTDTATSAATILAAGHDYVGLDGSTAALDATYCAALDAAGLKVWVRPTNESRTTHAYWIAQGAAGHISDEGLYVSGTNAHRVTSDPFGTGNWYHGHLVHPTINKTGAFLTSPTRWGYTTGGTSSSCVIGALCPIASPTDFTLTFTYHLDNEDSTTNRWGGVFIGTTDYPFDPFVTGNADNDGYHFLMRQNGVIDIYRIDNGTGTLLDTDTLAGLAETNSYDFTITVTPTSITFERDGVGSVTTNDTTYRGAYLHLTQSATSGHQCSWSAMDIA